MNTTNNFMPNKFNRLGEMVRLPKRHKLPKVIQKEMEKSE